MSTIWPWCSQAFGTFVTSYTTLANDSVSSELSGLLKPARSSLVTKTTSTAGCQLYLVRHGESTNNALPDAQRVPDPPLTELGHQQVRQLAQYYRNLDRIDRVLTSPFRRTLQTTLPLLEARDMRAAIWTDLFEVGGCFSGYVPGAMKGASGMTDTEIASEFPHFDIPGDIGEQGWYKCQPVETWELAELRAGRQAIRLRNNFEDHGADIPNTSVTHIQIENGKTSVLKYCDTAHLN